MAFWEYYFSECPSSNRGHSEKQYSHNAMVFKQGGILPIMPWFLNRGHSEKQYSHNAMVFKQGGILPIMPWFLKNSLKTLLSQRKVVKPCNNVKIPPFSSGHWNRCRPRASKTALGPRATLCGPRAVLEALGRHLFQSPSEKGGILAHNHRTVCKTVQ